jgi:hypothetical protein
MYPSKTIYRTKVFLIGFKSSISCRFLVPDPLTFYRLHDILQIVIGWQGHCLQIFHVGRQVHRDPEDDEYGKLQRILLKTAPLI